MGRRLEFSQILLVLQTIVYVTQAAFVQNTYRELGPGQNVTGNFGAEVTAESNYDCATR